MKNTNNNNSIQRVKMFKAKKHWVALGTTLAVASVIGTTGAVHADEVTPATTATPDTTAVQENTPTSTSDSTKVNTDDQKAAAKTYTAEQQAAIDKAQKNVDDDKSAIDSTQKDLDNAKKDQSNQQTIVDQNQKDVDQAQDALNAAKDQQTKDQDKADQLAPDGYAEKNVDQAQKDTDQAQKTVDTDKENIQSASNEKDEAQNNVNNSKKDLSEDQDNVNKAQNDVTNAKSNLDNTSKTIKVHHPANEAKPGSLTNGTVINSENELPNHLVKPSDADQYNSYAKQLEGGGDLDSYYNYVGNNDTSEKISNNTLTAEQQKEASQYALTLINDFRRQHGLAPIKMSQLSVEMAQNDANMRMKYGVSSFDHSFPGSDDQGGVSVEQWDNAMMRQLDPNFDTTSDLSHNYFIADQNLGTVDMNFAPTMLALKVRILQTIQDMAYADADWDNMHTHAFLRTQPYIIGTTDNLDNIWFALNIVNPDANGYSAMIFDMFETWNTSNGLTNKINSAFNSNQISGFVNTGYDSTENNPEYAKAEQSLNDASNKLSNAQLLVSNSQKDLASAESVLNAKSQALLNAISKLNVDKGTLSEAKTRLSNAQNVLNTAKQKYANQLATYNKAKQVVQDDQAKIEKLNSNLSVLQSKLKNGKSDLSSLTQEIHDLQNKLSKFEKQLINDEKILSDALNPSDSNNTSENKDNNESNESNNNNAINNTNNPDSNGTGTTGTSSTNESASKGNEIEKDTDKNDNNYSSSNVKNNGSGNIISKSGTDVDIYTHGETRISKETLNPSANATRMNYYHFGSNKKQINLNKNDKASTLPQTGDSDGTSEVTSLVGLALATATFGLLGRKRRHN